MNGPDYLAAAAALFNVFVFDKAIPIITMAVMFIAVAWLLFRAQGKEGFNIEEMFQDETGKASTARVLACFAFCVSSWDLMTARLAGHADPQYYFYYLSAWSGALVFIKLADKWTGELPFTTKKN